MSAAEPEVLLVDDQLGVRRGVELLLHQFGFRVAGVAATEAEAAALLRRRRYDVALVDTLLEGLPTAALLGELLAERADAPLVAYAGRDLDALVATADVAPPGLVLKASAAGTLLGALSAVAAGERYLDPAVSARLPAREPARAPGPTASLSPREREILLLLADGLSGAQIATRLYLSTETVRTHVRNAVQKVGARTRTQAVALLVAERQR